MNFGVIGRFFGPVSDSIHVFPIDNSTFLLELYRFINKALTPE